MPGDGRPIGLRAVIGVVVLVAVVALLLIAFYKPFPTIQVFNATDVELSDVVLETFGSETHAESFMLGTLSAGESGEVVVRSYEVSVLRLTYQSPEGEVEYRSQGGMLKPGQVWRMTIAESGQVEEMLAN